jgi:hypothetical protein
VLHREEMILTTREDEIGALKEVDGHRSTWMKGWIGK